MDYEGVSPIGRNVAIYRKHAKLSAEELADKAGAGLTRSIIANLENGRKHDVTVTQLIALAYVLGASPVELIYDLWDPYGDVAIVTSDEMTVTAQQWHAHGWFTQDSRQWRFPVTVNGNAEAYQDPSGSPHATRRYLVRKRGELLADLGLHELRRDEWVRDAAKALGTSEFQARMKLSDSPDWEELDVKIRDIKAELYEVDGQLRSAGVNIDRKPRLDDLSAPF